MEVIKRVLKRIVTDKGIYEIIVINNEKVFRKILKEDISKEINGYNLIKNNYRVPKMKKYNLDKREIIYEYIDNLENRTLHHGLFMNLEFSQKRIIDVLTNGFEKFEMLEESKSSNSKFFYGRISLLEQYISYGNEDYEKEIVVNNEVFPSFKKCVKTIINTLEIDKVVPFVISQGDPTDLNISVEGEITDFEMAGKNSVINEIAIFVGCYLVNCYYFYIKYMNSAHKKYLDTLDKYKDLIKCDFKKCKNRVLVVFNNILPTKNKEFIRAYLNRIKEIGIIRWDFNIGCYIAMRMISPVNMNKVSDRGDKFLLIALADLFTFKYNTLEKVIHFVEVM
ncbi:MAG: hypothetical protein Q4G05_06410 [Clostridia bacterium]|nr:hypothetical protein [Clostridia bacterium]